MHTFDPTYERHILHHSWLVPAWNTHTVSMPQTNTHPTRQSATSVTAPYEPRPTRVWHHTGSC